MADYLIKDARIPNLETGEIKDADILIENGQIVKIEPELVSEEEVTVIEAGKRYVTAGWIDAHVHRYTGKGSIGMDADQYLRQGVTYVVDAGTTGPGNFEDYLNSSVRGKKMPGKAYLNLASMGVIKEYGELTDLSKVNLETCKGMIRKYPDEIIGVKLRIDPRVCKEPAEAMRLIRQLSLETGKPLIVHASRCGSLEMGQLLSYMKKGDIFAHTYADKLPGILDENGKIKEAVRDARARGVNFDLSHGKSNFSFAIASAAIKQGFLPDAISTDLHQGSMDIVDSLAMTMSKTLACGVSLGKVLRLVTEDSAKMLGISDKSTSVVVGAPSDLTIFAVEEGEYTFVDSDGNTRLGDSLVKPYCTILGDEVYWN